MKCDFCSEEQPTLSSIDELMEWEEFHRPFVAPAHRKCTDECEEAATNYLAARARADHLPDRPQGEDLNITK